MTEKFVNRVSTTLNGALSSSTQGAVETITLASVAGLPTTGEFRLLVDAEIFKATSVNVGANTVTGARGSEGTTAASHLTGATITMIITSGGLGQLATDTLARIAATSPLSVSLNGSGDPTLAIQAADASHNGYFSSSDYTKLVGVATGAQVNVLESVSATAPIAVAAVSSKNQVISLAAASGAAAGSMSAAHYSLVNGATDAATASALAKRDASGDITFRFVNGSRLLQTTDDNLAAQPQRLFGKQAADNYIRSFNPASVTVGAAAALAAGADRTKLDAISVAVGTDSTGLYSPIGKTLLGKQRWMRQQIISSPASTLPFQYADQDIATPNNLDWRNLIWSVAAIGRNSYRYKAEQQTKGNLDTPVDYTHWSTIVSMGDNTTNLSAVTGVIRTTLIVEEL